MSPTKWTRVGAIVVAAMLAAACGSSAEPASGPDSDLLTPDGRLKTPTDVTINVASRAVLDFSSPLLAHELGVFEKYGINLKVESVPTNEAVPLLATGKIDVLIGGLNAGVFNAITGGYNIKVVAPANYQAPDSNIGIWASTKWLNGREISAEVLRGSTHASSQGYQGITMVSYVQLLRKYGLDVNDVNIETMPQTDQVVALETGAIATGTPSPAGTAALAETGAAVFVAPQIPQGWPVVVFMFGPNLLNDRPEVGYAFVAAMRDLYKNYLQPGYKDNPEVFKALVKVSEQSEEAIRGHTEFVYKDTLSIPDDYISTMDETWRLFPDVLVSEEPLTFGDVVDTRFMEFANSLDI